MKATARSLSIALLLCLTVATWYRAVAQTSPGPDRNLASHISTLPSPNLVYGTTRYFDQLSFMSNFALADINNDGVLDLIAPQYHAFNIAISLGDAAHPGTFLPPTFLQVPTSYTEFVSVADMNADGLLDIVYGDRSSQFAGILFQDHLHPGSFLTSVTLGSPVSTPLVADMNRDGFPDVVLFEQTGTVILFNDPTHPGSFSRKTVAYLNPPDAAIVVDMDGDGLPDIVTDDDAFVSTVSVILNDVAHPGNLLSPHDYPAGGWSFDLAAGDLNGDGLPDVVIGGLRSGISVLLSNSAHPGALLPPVLYPVATTPPGTETSGIAMGDVNGDGKLDVVLGNAGSAFSLMLGNGDGTLATAVSYPTGPIPKTFYTPALTIADIDGDGLRDVIAGQLFQNSVQVFLHRPSAIPLSISGTDQILSTTTPRPGDPVTFTINVSAFQGVPSGTVTLYRASTVIFSANTVPTYTPVATLPLDSTGTATYTDHFQNGTYSFRSFYPGDRTYAPSTTLFDTVTVGGNPTVALSIVASPNPAAPGENVILTAAIAPLLPIPTGTITFLDNGAMLGSIPLGAAGTAVFNTSSLTPGTHTITAQYSGDTQYAPQQASTTETIRYPAAQLTLTSSLNPATAGQTVIFQAKATASGPAPTGTLTFRDNGASLARLPLAADGTAAYSTTALTVGTHLILATYSGDGNYDTQSTTLTEIVVAQPPPVQPGDFTLSIGSPLTLGAQRSGTAILTVTPLNGLADTIALSCGALPVYTTCKIVPPTASISGSTAQQATIQIAVDKSPAYAGLRARTTLLLAAAFPFLCRGVPRVRIRRRLAIFVLLPLVGGGCGFSKSPLSTPPGTYSIVIAAHGATSHLDRSATLMLIVR